MISCRAGRSLQLCLGCSCTGQQIPWVLLLNSLPTVINPFSKANYFKHKTHCVIRKLTAGFASKSGVFTRFNFSTKMAEFLLSVPQIWRSRKRVTIQIQLMNVYVSECKYHCLHLVLNFGDVCSRQNRRLHPTAHGKLNKTNRFA